MSCIIPQRDASANAAGHDKKGHHVGRLEKRLEPLDVRALAETASREFAEKLLRREVRRADAVLALNVATDNHRELHVEVLVAPATGKALLEKTVKLDPRALDRAHPVFLDSTSEIAQQEPHGGNHGGYGDKRERTPADELPRKRRQVLLRVGLHVAGHCLAGGRVLEVDRPCDKRKRTLVGCRREKTGRGSHGKRRNLVDVGAWLWYELPVDGLDKRPVRVLHRLASEVLGERKAAHAVAEIGNRRLDVLRRLHRHRKKDAPPWVNLRAVGIDLEVDPVPAHLKNRHCYKD